MHLSVLLIIAKTELKKQSISARKLTAQGHQDNTIIL